MKTYYQKLKPIVSGYVEHFLTDFTKHDRKCLAGYTGEFYYGIRKTGTDIFLFTKALEALSALATKQESSYFSLKGLKAIYEGGVDFGVDHCLAYCLLERRENDRFFIGERMEVIEISKEEFDCIFRRRIAHLNELADQFKGSPLVYSLYEKALKEKEQKRKEQAAA